MSSELDDFSRQDHRDRAAELMRDAQNEKDVADQRYQGGREREKALANAIFYLAAAQIHATLALSVDETVMQED